MTSNSETLHSILELNLMYLQTAQRLLADNPQAAREQLGLSDELADVIGKLTFAQTLKLAKSSQILCSFRMSGGELLSGLAEKITADEVSSRTAAPKDSLSPVTS